MELLGTFRDSFVVFQEKLAGSGEQAAPAAAQQIVPVCLKKTELALIADSIAMQATKRTLL